MRDAAEQLKRAARVERAGWRLAGICLAVAAAGALTGGCQAEGTDSSDSTPPSGSADPSDGGDGSPSPPSPEGLPAPDEARELLDGLTVADERSMTGYSRDRFPHWSSQDGCTVRQEVLRRDGEDVVTNDDCQPTSGSWYSAYDGETYTDPADVDIDHVVPLANAWRSGADAWTDERREAFANDLEGPQLIAVGDRVNQSKGDQSPDQWLPPVEAYGCDYARAWVAVKAAYELNVTEPERQELDALLDTCGGA
ncbi:HNH endonuclease [Streptomyces sp. PT12]|nr:HNH endonuclease [Streptomyces sp. PT12]